jgi:hypothetical protein
MKSTLGIADIMRLQAIERTRQRVREHTARTDLRRDVLIEALIAKGWTPDGAAKFLDEFEERIKDEA